MRVLLNALPHASTRASNKVPNPRVRNVSSGQKTLARLRRCGEPQARYSKAAMSWASVLGIYPALAFSPWDWLRISSNGVCSYSGAMAYSSISIPSGSSK